MADIEQIVVGSQVRLDGSAHDWSVTSISPEQDGQSLVSLHRVEDGIEDGRTMSVNVVHMVWVATP